VNGGHLASSLGVVELTLALHYVFNTPMDRIVWDVGHQAYAHKILTGRRDQFSTIRLYGGLSGFPKREESPFDAFDVGHSSTSISAGYGMVVARDLLHQNHKIISVIGDGSLTAGLAFEGLNNAGGSNRDYIVILNDNRISISKNVGALSKYLTEILANPSYNRIKKDIWLAMERFEFAKEIVRPLISHIDKILKSLLVPGMMFEHFGFRYFGPIDGHDIPLLIDTFKKINQLSGSIFVHIITTKGKGFEFAEADAEKYHGIGGTRNKKNTSTPTFTEIFGKTIVRLAEDDTRVLAITAAMGHHGGLTEFSRRFPERFFDVGIAEPHALTFAAGLAIERRLKPVVMMYNTFLQRAYDALIHDIALQKAPVVLAIDRTGLVGADGPTHHGQLGFSFLRAVPNLIIAVPSNENQLQNLLYTAVYYPHGPFAILYPRSPIMGVELSHQFEEMPVGKGICYRQGEDITIIAIGTMVATAVAVASMLENYFDISVSVIDLVYIKPLDEDLLEKVFEQKAARRLVFLEENTIMGGFSSAVLEFLVDRQHPIPAILRIGLPDRFITHGTVQDLYRELKLMPEQVLKSILERFYPRKLQTFYENFNLA